MKEFSLILSNKSGKKSMASGSVLHQSVSSSANKKHKSDDADKLTCMECKSCIRQVIFFPCSHLVCCFNCSHALTGCPVCKMDIKARATVYI
ncbi:uncharacterized protein [Watersipora subatra]|uniref:uncharacterized protein n=1 Tax=Watersipora subatra TaxID=2589382 RepID=UPI00355BF3EF